MPYITSKNNYEELNLYYEDLGTGKPIVFSSGWPLSHAMWEYQCTPLREAGFRCITYDRRGFGISEQSLDNYSYDVLADDLKNLLDELNLNEVTLVGFSMGGGDVVRYCTKYNSARVSKLALISSIVPYMLKTDDNPDGVPLEQIQEFEKQIRADRPAFLENFAKQFYGVGFLNHPVSNAILQWTSLLALPASQKAMLACMKSFSQTDFRKEAASISIPTLIIHGDSDKVVPIAAAGEKAASIIPNFLYKVYTNAPHALFYTHKDELNIDIASFAATGALSEHNYIANNYAVLPSNEPLITR